MHFSGLWEKELSGRLILPSSPACTRNRLFIKGLELQHLCLGGKKAVGNGVQVSAALIYSGRNDKKSFVLLYGKQPMQAGWSKMW